MTDYRREGICWIRTKEPNLFGMELQLLLTRNERKRKTKNSNKNNNKNTNNNKIFYSFFELFLAWVYTEIPVINECIFNNCQSRSSTVCLEILILIYIEHLKISLHFENFSCSLSTSHFAMISISHDWSMFFYELTQKFLSIYLK